MVYGHGVIMFFNMLCVGHVILKKQNGENGQIRQLGQIRQNNGKRRVGSRENGASKR